MGMKNILITASILGLLLYFRKYWTSDDGQGKTYAFVTEGYDGLLKFGISIHDAVFYIKANSIEEAKTKLRKETSNGIVDILVADTFDKCFSKVDIKYTSKTNYVIEETEAPIKKDL